MAETRDETPTPQAKPAPLEVVIVATAEPLPVAAVYPLPVSIAEAIDPITGRPVSLPPDPTSAQLAVERAALHKANNGSFSIEAERPAIAVPRPADPMRNLSIFYAFHVFEAVAIALLLLIGALNFLALHPWSG